MTPRLLACCFLMAVFGLFSPSRAQADELFTFQFDGNTFTWELPASPSPSVYVPGAFFDIANVPFSENGVSQTSETLAFMSTANGGGFILWLGKGTALRVTGQQVFGGSAQDPTFSPNTYELTGPGGAVGTLVVGGTLGSTPEPSNLLLMGTGVLTLLGFARKKIMA